MLHSARWPMHALLLEYIAKRQGSGALRNIHPELVFLALIAMPAHLGMITNVFGFAIPIELEDAAAAFSKILMDGIRVPQNAKVPSPVVPIKSVKNSRSHAQVR
jgi:hypothetical protein